MPGDPAADDAAAQRLDDLALARATVDRAASLRTDPAGLAAAWAEPRAGVVLVDPDGRTLVVELPDGRARLAVVTPPTADALEPAADRLLLGREADGSPWFAVRLTSPVRPPLSGPAAEAVAAGLREVGDRLDAHDAGLLVPAVALAHWHRTHTRCPRCGAATEVAQGGFVRVCPEDGSEHYPRTDPAVIVLVTDASGERALLGRQRVWPSGRFSTLAGFVEPGESAEAAVVREVAEEAGVTVGRVTYRGSQPWPFPASLMLAFTAVAEDPDQARPDGAEIEELRWLTRDELVTELGAGRLRLPPRVSVARRLVEQWFGGELPEPDERARW